MSRRFSNTKTAVQPPRKPNPPVAERTPAARSRWFRSRVALGLSPGARPRPSGEPSQTVTPLGLPGCLPSAIPLASTTGPFPQLLGLESLCQPRGYFGSPSEGLPPQTPMAGVISEPMQTSGSPTHSELPGPMPSPAMGFWEIIPQRSGFSTRCPRALHR